MPQFHKIHFNADETPAQGSEPVPDLLKGMVRTGGGPPAIPEPIRMNAEAAARTFVSAFLDARREGDLFRLTAPDRPELVPDLRLESAQESPLSRTHVMRFEQTRHQIPIFGTGAVVEITDRDRRLVALDATLSDIPDISPIAKVGAADALRAIADYCGVPQESLSGVDAPALNYYLHGKERWYLTYHFQKVPAIPPARAKENRPEKGAHGHGFGGSPREDFAVYDFLVDAHGGGVVFHFPSHALIDVPTLCHGLDEVGIDREFNGLATGQAYQLLDPMRDVVTYDHGFKDIRNQQLPAAPIGHAVVDFASTHTAGVSAHYFATKVFDFYNDVLKRSGVDDKGMRLISMVNCTYSKHNPPPDWRNAVWWNGRMWYGQVKTGNGGFDSYARHFDVIAHELTHGVTETTSNLVYQDLSGALNESFSDIFGVIVKNWYPGEPNPIGNWNWEIGTGLGRNGLPLRDMSDPSRTGDPDHMSQYKPVPYDHGGVHIYSNIHNKAAYNVLTAKDQSGAYVFTPEEIAILYYLTLTRLTSMADFSDCLRVLKSVANTRWAGQPTLQAKMRQAIEDAYRVVGIV